jgi:serine phosphatase RsbU (regulator of sigma subunit)
MSLRARVILAILITAVLLGGMTAYTVTQLRHWDEIGLTGLAFWPHLTQEKRPPLKIFSPGRVFMVFPTSPAQDAGIRGGDTILAINGIPTEDNARLIETAPKLRRGDIVVYRVRRDNTIRDVRVPLESPQRIPLMLMGAIVSALVAAAYIAVGLLVLLKRPDDRRVLVFYAMMTVGAVYLIGTPGLTLDSSNLRGLHAEVTGKGFVPLLAMMSSLIAFLPLTLHLALIFPRERPIFRTSPHVLRWVYGVPAALVVTFSILLTIAYIGMQRADGAKWLDLPMNVFSALITLTGLALAWRIVRVGRAEGFRLAFWRRPIQSIYVIIAVILGAGRIAEALDVRVIGFIAGVLLALTPMIALFSFPVLSCISLYRSYRDAGAEERRQVKWPLWGTISALATRLIIAVIGQAVGTYVMFSDGDFDHWLNVAQFASVLTTLVYLLIPISFAVAILKYRLMDIDIIIRKTVVYAALSAAIVVLYLGIVGLLGTILVRVAGVKSQTTIIGATLIVALAFVPMRNKLQSLVERTLFRHKYDYAAALRAVSGEALAAQDLGHFLSSVAEKVQHALQNRAVVIFGTRHDEFVAAAKVGVADSLVGSLRVAQKPLLAMLDRPFDPRRHALPDDAASALKKVEASLVVPVNTPGTPANGFIALAPKLSGAEFDVEDIDFLRSVADQLDIGMDRIRLQREDADYSQARSIQQSLLPREMPEVAGLEVSGIWQPARTMGGDYFDVLELSETELAICIGDVAGKGMPAALLMSGLQAAVRASASSSPRDLCERVRRVVVSSLAGGRFVTFFYAIIDTAAMRLRWTNAGHNAPVLARADGTIVRLDEGGPAISRLFKDAYEERELPLLPGDRLVLFTDGVSEATDRSGDLFGEQRIEELVAANPHASAEELQRTIVSAATSFASEIEDDVTLVVVKAIEPLSS